VDEITGQPIPYVLIYDDDQNQTAYTDLDGKADISSFSRDQPIFFRHPSYLLISLRFEELQGMDFRVLLTEDVVNMKEVVISASKWEQDRTEIPNKIVSIRG
jgi:hemoglobin/transferrin/lactoferrin receptor protein